MSKRMGLVLTGGGGKGAYEVGVWKAFREYGIDTKITAISGTSVGALNAALFMQGDYEIAEKVWMNLSTDKILTFNKEQMIKKVSRRLPVRLLEIFKSLSEKVIGHGWFSREGLLEIMNEELDLASVSKSTLTGFGTCLNSRTLKAEYFNLNHKSRETITSILLASSAIPFVFDPVEINSESYWDGGVPLPDADNIPIKPLYDLGCDLIFVVHLNRTNLINKADYPNAKIVEIIPDEHQGGFFTGTLDFTASGSKRRLEQGYQDAKRIIEPIYEMIKTQYLINQIMHQSLKDEKEFIAKRENVLNEREQLKNELHQMMEQKKL